MGITSVLDDFRVGTALYGKPLSFSRLVHPVVHVMLLSLLSEFFFSIFSEITIQKYPGKIIRIDIKMFQKFRKLKILVVSGACDDNR